MFSIARVRRRGDHPQCGLGNYQEMERENESYHLIFWLLGTFIDIRDQAWGLVA
jgi:hypothetical protein